MSFDVLDRLTKIAPVRSAVRFATVLVLVLTLGLHWALLQTLAWTGMIIAYSQENPFRDAVRMTFDGEHPCAMCKTIKQGRSEERKQDQQKLAPRLKLEFPLPTESVRLTTRDFTEIPPARDRFSPSFFSKPPTPPPRPCPVV